MARWVRDGAGADPLRGGRVRGTFRDRRRDPYALRIGGLGAERVTSWSGWEFPFGVAGLRNRAEEWVVFLSDDRGGRSADDRAGRTSQTG